MENKSIISLFVTWLGDFEADVKRFGLEIVNVEHEIGGCTVTVSGDYTKLSEYLTECYFPGMDDESIIDLMDSIVEE
ncbi:hypothetical protein CkP1_0258 [Citrobacter phage CkP1]|nr:hypothetical protein CkP1_0258 [Citrobacter phage CkP1]